MNIFYFDIDGTLLNVKKEIVYNIWKNAAIQHFEIDFKKKYSFKGSTDYNILCNFFNNSFTGSTSKLVFKNSYINEHQNILKKEHIKKLNGIDSFLGEIRKAGKLIIVTGNFYENAVLKLEISGLNKYFNELYACETELNKTAILKKAKKKILLNYANITNEIYFGDTENDMIAANKNNMKYIHIGLEARNIISYKRFNDYLNISPNELY